MKNRIVATGLALAACASLMTSCGASHRVEAVNAPEPSVIPSGVQAVAYNPHVDYMKLMVQCAEHNTDYSMMIGAIYEAQRNLKIEYMKPEGVEKTNYFTSLDGELVLSKMIPQSPEIKKYYTEADAVMLAKVMFLEGRGTYSKTELSCIAWTVLNRVDNGKYGGSISAVVTAPNQFAYRASAPTVSDYGYDLVEIATDVLDRWSAEKAGETDVGRTLPSDYLWYAGDGSHNYFRNAYKGGVRWNYSLPSPYEN